jgi:hypothetical protein
MWYLWYARTGLESFIHSFIHLELSIIYCMPDAFLDPGVVVKKEESEVEWSFWWGGSRQ